MTQAKFDRESQRLGELASPTSAFLLLKACFLLKAWGNIVALVAISVACVSLSVASAPAAFDAVVSSSSDSAAYGTRTASDAAYLQSAPSPWSGDQSALESECDDLDSDSETTAAGSHSLEVGHRHSLLEKAPNPGTLLPAAHLLISVGFARGPPSVG